MKFRDPLDVTCPRCGVESQHRLCDWLSLAVNCPACGCSLAERAAQTKALIDGWTEFVTYAEVAWRVEDRLGVTINDRALFKSDRPTGLTLRGLASLVAEQFPETAAAARRHVCAAAEDLTGRPLSEGDLDRPLFELLRAP
jgi:hypothetical protein